MINWVFELGDKLPMIDDAATAIHAASSKR